MDSIIPLDDTPLKQCKGSCGQFFPDTTEYFPCKRQKYKGLDKIYLSRTCRQCAKEAHHARHLLAKANPPEVPPGILIVCSVCQKPKPATEEFFDRYPCNTGRYGFASECKPCKTEKMYTRRRTPKGKAREKELRKSHYDANPEHFRRQRMRYFYANQKIENERSRVYGHAHCRERNQKRRVRAKAIPGTHTATQIQELLRRQRYRCYYCHKKFEKVRVKGKIKYTYDIEHTFPLSRVTGTGIPANDISYLVLSCHPCNQEKGDKFPWEYFKGGRLL